MSKSTPGDFYRHLVRGLIPEENQQAVDNAGLEAALEQALEDASQETTPSLVRYIAATGLLACGRAEMVELVLGNVPLPVEEGGGGKTLYLGTNALRALLPLPQSLQGDGGWCSYPDLDGVRSWWDKNRNKLSWNARQERFVLADAVSAG